MIEMALVLFHSPAIFIPAHVDLITWLILLAADLSIAEVLESTPWIHYTADFFHSQLAYILC